MLKQLTNPARILVIILSLPAISACTSLPANINQAESYAYNDTNNTQLAIAADSHLQQHPDKDAFMPLLDGVNAFVARALLA